MDDDLVQFLRARLDEDAALASSGETWTAFEENEQTGTRRVDVDHSIERVVACTRSWRGEHIARHDPARVLAEVDGKRRRLDTYEAACRRRDAEQQDFVDWAGGDARADRPSFAGPDPALIPGLEYAIRQDARVYRDHPDFDPSWLEN